MTCWKFRGAVAGIAIALAWLGPASAAESDLSAGLAHLRAGDQVRAEQELTRYRHGERDAGVQRSIDRVLPLLRRPLPDDVREYLAKTIEDAAGLRVDTRSERPRPNYLSRMFPVFP